MTARQQWRRDDAAAWTAANPTLLAGEAGLETDTGRIKVGDGTTAWADLPYAFPREVNPAGGADNYAPIEAPTFTGQTTVDTLAVTGTTGDLDVDGTIHVEPTDPATIPLTVRAAESQAGNLAAIMTDTGDTLLIVSPSGATRLRNGADFAVMDAAGSADRYTRMTDGEIAAQKSEGNRVYMDGDAVGTPTVALGVRSAGSVSFYVTGEGQVRKPTLSTFFSNEVLNKTEQDSRYQQILRSVAGVGQIRTFRGTDSAVSFNLGAGQWVYFYLVLDNNSDIQRFSGVGVGQGTGTETPVSSPVHTWAAVAFRTA